MIKKLRVTVDGNSYDVTVEIPDEGATFSPAPAAPAPVAAPAPRPATPAPAPTPAPAAAPVAKGPVAPGDVLSPLTGRVVAVSVTVGQAVKEGDPLLTLEAMKMNTFIVAPKTGKVTQIKVAAGDSVEENQALVRVE